ncbi:MAG TPA: DUF2752 domain-containing protein [Acidimicrobiia bacterium]
MTAIWRDRVILFSPMAVIVALALAPAAEDGPTICPVALCTGTACPGCGMTRAASRLLRGDVGAALSFHPLIPLIALLAVAGWTWFVLVRAGKIEPPDRGLVNGVLVLTAIALVAVWIVRLVTGTLPAV